MFGFRNKKNKRKKTEIISRRQEAFRKKNNKEKLKNIKKLRLPKKIPNLNLLFLTILLLTGGLLMIFSASALIAYSTRDGDTFFYFKRQIIWIVLGSMAGLVFYILPIALIKKLSPLMLAGSLMLLLYILPEALFGKTAIDGTTTGIQMPFVNQINGATRWIDIGSFSLQPSELIKFTLVIYLSAWLTRDFKISKKDPTGDHMKKVLFPFLFIAGIISVLILLQRDFDTTVIIFLTILMVYYMSGNDRLHTIGTYGIGFFASLFGSLALILEPYRRSRVACFFDIFINGRPTGDKAQADCFQVWNGLVALGSGGLFGVGYGESRQKLGFLQEAAYTDSIFVIIGEEFGLIGAIFVIVGFLYFASLGLKIASDAPDKFSSLLAIGMTSWIVIQAFLNIAANLAVIPFGGMPLPFFTYGGSSTIVALMSVGLLLNISKKHKHSL